MTIDQILTKLETPYDSIFQREALEEAVLQQEAVTPALLKIIDHIANDPEFLDDNPDYMGFTYALYLLAQFREKKAYPLIVQYFGQLGLEVEAIYSSGDIVYEGLNSILASVCQGDLGLIKQLIEDSKVNPFVRIAALASLVVLYNNDQLSREDLVAYFRTLIDNSLKQEDDPDFVASLVNFCCDIHPDELYDALVVCFERDIIDTSLIGKKDLDYYMHREKEETLAELKKDCHSQLINNVITEMEWWACFKPKFSSNYLESSSTASFNEDKKPKVGRNDPCPCGSGKKYKKCCLKN